jgi:hypothetical protein
MPEQKNIFTIHLQKIFDIFMGNPARKKDLDWKQRRGILRSLGSPPPSSSGFIRADSGSHAHNYPSAILIIPLPLFHGVSPCCMSLLMSMLHVQAACPCCLYMLNVHAACPCWMSVLNVHAACPCSMSMLHVHAPCPCFMLLLHVHAACSC